MPRHIRLTAASVPPHFPALPPQFPSLPPQFPAVPRASVRFSAAASAALSPSPVYWTCNAIHVVPRQRRTAVRILFASLCQLSVLWMMANLERQSSSPFHVGHLGKVFLPIWDDYIDEQQASLTHFLSFSYAIGVGGIVSRATETTHSHSRASGKTI
ncbi:hypothetical protein B0H13DRAFT_2319900 [Mycena leptocephala]|nr:hypothetical protein B0H13DRAFT_2319900 [Mycena leptocephala]